MKKTVDKVPKSKPVPEVKQFHVEKTYISLKQR